MLYGRKRRREGLVVRTFLNVVSQRPHSDGHNLKTRGKRGRKAKTKKRKRKKGQRSRGGRKGLKG